MEFELLILYLTEPKIAEQLTPKQRREQQVKELQLQVSLKGISYNCVGWATMASKYILGQFAGFAEETNRVGIPIAFEKEY